MTDFTHACRECGKSIRHLQGWYGWMWTALDRDLMDFCEIKQKSKNQAMGWWHVPMSNLERLSV